MVLPSALGTAPTVRFYICGRVCPFRRLSFTLLVKSSKVGIRREKDPVANKVSSLASGNLCRTYCRYALHRWIQRSEAGARKHPRGPAEFGQHLSEFRAATPGDL